MVATAASVLGFVYCISLLNWWGPLVWFVTFCLVANQLSQPTIDRGDSRAQSGTVIGASISIAMGYHAYLSPHASLSTNALFGILSAFLGLLWLKLLVTKPVTVKSETASDRDILARRLADSTEAVSICATCLVEKGDNMFHCSRCDVCVVDIDQHCLAIQNCVARGNRRTFNFFSLAGFCSFSIFVVVALHVQHSIHCPNATGMLWSFLAVQLCMLNDNLVFTIVTYFAFFLAGVCLNNFLLELYFISIDTTTYNIVRLNHDGKCRSPYSTSFRNILNFCSTGNYKVVNFPVVRAERYDDSDYSVSHGHSHGHGHRGCCGQAPPEPAYADVGHSLTIDAAERA